MPADAVTKMDQDRNHWNCHERHGKKETVMMHYLTFALVPTSLSSQIVFVAICVFMVVTLVGAALYSLLPKQVFDDITISIRCRLAATVCSLQGSSILAFWINISFLLVEFFLQ